MIDVKGVMESAFYNDELFFEYSSEEKIIQYVEHIISAIEKDGLTYMQAHEVLKVCDKVLKRKKLELEKID